MSIFRENKSFCACANTKENVLNCNCGEKEQEPVWKWDENARTEATTLSHNNQQVYFHKGYSHGNACIRGDTPFVNGYDYYWEVKIISTVYGSSMVGIKPQNFDRKLEVIFVTINIKSCAVNRASVIKLRSYLIYKKLLGLSRYQQVIVKCSTLLFQ